MVSPAKIVNTLLFSPDSSSDSPTCVLLVDDNEDLCDVVSEMLRASGLEVLSATNGTAALETIRRYPNVIDVLVTDIHMPDMLGTELARRAALLRPEMRVLFVSADPGAALRTGQLDPNAQTLHKPFDRRLLLHELRKAVGR
jgi:CheY-like chemotaxis protein